MASKDRPRRRALLALAAGTCLFVAAGARVLLSAQPSTRPSAPPRGGNGAAPGANADAGEARRATAARAGSQTRPAAEHLIRSVTVRRESPSEAAAGPTTGAAGDTPAAAAARGPSAEGRRPTGNATFTVRLTPEAVKAVRGTLRRPAARLDGDTLVSNTDIDFAQRRRDRQRLAEDWRKAGNRNTVCLVNREVISADLDEAQAERMAQPARDAAPEESGGADGAGREGREGAAPAGASDAPAASDASEECPEFPTVDPGLEQRLISKSIMITDLKVVEDPVRTTGDGPWTFKHLMTAMANAPETGIRPEEFVRRWLAHWEQAQTVNGFSVAARQAGIRKLIIDPWVQASGGPGKPLDLNQAPFRLLAIGSRLDLRHNLVLGAERIGGAGAGEARFVFCAVDKRPPGERPGPPDVVDPPLPFTVIFEYGVKRETFETGPRSVRAWATQWYALSDPSLELGSEEYNKRLQRLTDQFAGANADPESPPNRSGLSQLRTNEIALGFALAPPLPLWEIREFRIAAQDNGFLNQVTVKQTPDLGFNQSPVLAGYINGAESDILANRHRTPAQFPPGSPFLGGSAPTVPNAGPVPNLSFWSAPGVNPRARHLFSLGTCSGCHAGEAFPKLQQPDNLFDPDAVPPHFTHVRPRLKGHEAKLSPFLTGVDLPDPVTGETHSFNDLRGRAEDLHRLVVYGSVWEQCRLPRQMTH